MKARVFRTVLAVIGIAVIAVVVLTIINRRDQGGRALPIDTYKVTRGSLEEEVTGTGTFDPEESANVAARVSGQIQAIDVSEGQTVTNGQLLLQIDSSDYRLSLEQAQAALDSARRSVQQSLVTLRAAYRSALAAYDQAKRLYDKNTELYKAKAISEDDMKSSENSYTTAQVNLESTREQLNLRLDQPLSSDPQLDLSKDSEIISQAPEVVQASYNVDVAKDNLAKCFIRSPIAGTVTQIVPDVGDFATPNVTLMTVENLSSIQAVVQIDEVDIGKLSLGNKAAVTSDSLLGQTLNGTVVRIAPTITTTGSTRVSEVRISLAGNDVKLRSGASCSVQITSQTKQNVLYIPITGFLSRNGKDTVFLLKSVPSKDTKAPSVYRLEETEITTGISTINSIEVSSGLSEGDVIALGTLNQYRTGMLVTRKADL